MADFFPEVQINQDQAEAFARGLLAVARADGEVHEREAALIGQFFASTSSSSSGLGALERTPPIDGATLALLLPTPELRRVFVKTALLVAFADNTKGDGETAVIGAYAEALGVPGSEVVLLETQVKEFLLSQLSHLANVDAAAEVARGLKL